MNVEPLCLRHTWYYPVLGSSPQPKKASKWCKSFHALERMGVWPQCAGNGRDQHISLEEMRSGTIAPNCKRNPAGARTKACRNDSYIYHYSIKYCKISFWLYCKAISISSKPWTCTIKTESFFPIRHGRLSVDNCTFILHPLAIQKWINPSYCCPIMRITYKYCKRYPIYVLRCKLNKLIIKF